MRQYRANRTPEVTTQERKGAEVSLELLREGIVLLENRDFLPIAAPGKIALYGAGARNTLYGGLGAASIHIRRGISIEEGLRQEGFVITTEGWLDRYSQSLRAAENAYYQGIRSRCGENILDGVLDMYGHPFCPPEEPEILAEDVRRSEADTAIYVISRCSGEGADRKPARGDFMLSDSEARNLKRLERNYAHLIVILNTCGVMDSREIRGLANLRAVLFCGMGAQATGQGVAEVISGRVNPSGRLTSTWAERYGDYPFAEQYAGVNGEPEEEYYREGIYVGYRWFDEREIMPAWPFGYGLSYTTFEIKTGTAAQREQQILLPFTVQNTGGRAGKEVVQLYAAAPSGRVPKAVRSLVGFAKSALLKPGEKEELQIALPVRQLASFDEKISAWVLEAGDYRLYLSENGKDLIPAGVIRVESESVLERCRPFQQAAEFTPLRRNEAAAKNRLPDIAGAPVLRMNLAKWQTETHKYGSLKGISAGDEKVIFSQVLSGEHTPEELAGSLTISELARLLVGNVPENAGKATRASTLAAGTGMVSRGGEDLDEVMVPGASETTNTLLRSRGIPKLNLCDGGSGLRLMPEFQTDREGRLMTSPLFSIGNVDRFAGDLLRGQGDGLRYWQYATAFPMAMVMAQTWNQELLCRCGDIIGAEAERFGVDIWLAPSMNIHRNPLCGRNYEYYSEDPLLTGRCATSVLHGFQKHAHAAACIKHLACNNQEENREGTNAHVSAQALREIYLRGFEIAVREEKPASLMTSLNLINGIHAANHRELLTTVLREEWGFDGVVMTDWGTTTPDDRPGRKYACSSVPGCIHAGNDLIMPGTKRDQERIQNALQEGILPLEEARLSASRLIRLMTKLRRG